MILRVPGIGVKSALKIVSARRFSSLDFDDLKKLGIVMKRARYFITCKGKHYGIKSMREELIRMNMMDKSSINPGAIQLSMFDPQGRMLT